MSLTPPFFPKSPSLRLSARVAILLIRNGSWCFLVVAPSLVEGFQDWVPRRPGGGCFLGVRGSSVNMGRWPGSLRAWRLASPVVSARGLSRSENLLEILEGEGRLSVAGKPFAP